MNDPIPNIIELLNRGWILVLHAVAEPDPNLYLALIVPETKARPAPPLALSTIARRDDSEDPLAKLEAAVAKLGKSGYAHVQAIYGLDCAALQLILSQLVPRVIRQHMQLTIACNVSMPVPVFEGSLVSVRINGGQIGIELTS